MYIIFDTNIWFSELGLNSEAGAAVRLFINKREATVVVPEVVRLELERKLIDELKKWKEDIVESHRKLLTVFGELKEVVLPTDQEIEERARNIIGDLGVCIREIPLSLDACKSAFIKVINKQPPSDVNQQFKDGVIWANCLELLNESDVYLVSADKGFFKNKKYADGLAPNLLKETKAYPHELKIMSELKKLLSEIRTEIEIDEQDLVEAVLSEQNQNITRLLEESEFVLGSGFTMSRDLFLTENPSRLYVEYEMNHQCVETSDQGRSAARLYAKGTGSYDIKKETFDLVRLSTLRLEYTDSQGETRTSGTAHYVSANFVLGPKILEHSVKKRLSELDK